MPNVPVHIYMSYNVLYVTTFPFLDEVSKGLMLRDHVRSWSSPGPDPVSAPVLLKEFLSVEETDNSLTVLTPVRLH